MKKLLQKLAYRYLKNTDYPFPIATLPPIQVPPIQVNQITPPDMLHICLEKFVPDWDELMTDGRTTGIIKDELAREFANRIEIHRDIVPGGYNYKAHLLFKSL